MGGGGHGHRAAAGSSPTTSKGQPSPAGGQLTPLPADEGTVTVGGFTPKGPDLEIRWDRTYFRRVLVAGLVALLAVGAIDLLAFGENWRGDIVIAIACCLPPLVRAARESSRARRAPVAAKLDDFGVTFDRHGPVAWDSFREVHLGLAKPHVLFVFHPLHYVAFLPKRGVALPMRTRREGHFARAYGSPLVLMTHTVTPSAGAILSAVERLSDVRVSR